MNSIQKELMRVAMSFKNLNITSMLPNVTHGEMCLLREISLLTQNEEKEIRVSDLVHALRVSPPAVSRTLKTMEEKELIQRWVDDKDRRNTFVSLTEAGVKKYQEIDRIMNDFADAVFGEMGEESMIRLKDYLIRLYELSEKEINQRKIRE